MGSTRKFKLNIVGCDFPVSCNCSKCTNLIGWPRIGHKKHQKKLMGLRNPIRSTRRGFKAEAPMFSENEKCSNQLLFWNLLGNLNCQSSSCCIKKSLEVDVESEYGYFFAISGQNLVDIEEEDGCNCSDKMEWNFITYILDIQEVAIAWNLSLSRLNLNNIHASADLGNWTHVKLWRNSNI